MDLSIVTQTNSGAIYLFVPLIISSFFSFMPCSKVMESPKSVILAVLLNIVKFDVAVNNSIAVNATEP
ncbi:hypothetical protein H5410_032900 [Solanum commersonii]|uniref:Uncharacterized protein n=1 Tax=Solanum commersonii TaxID=4109 RepID=A0A9J5YM68_SOLCO|nr:hypothetical protein H5410_032900 [Solanum commersonii]